MYKLVVIAMAIIALSCLTGYIFMVQSIWLIGIIAFCIMVIYEAMESSRMDLGKKDKTSKMNLY